MQEQTVGASRIHERIQANKFENTKSLGGKFFAIRNETTVRNLLCPPETNIEEPWGSITKEPRDNFNCENAWAISRERNVDSGEWILWIC